MDVDPALVRAVQRGEPGAMEDLIRATYAQVHRRCLRLLGNPSDAADATQEVFLRVSRSIMAFRGEAAFTTWLHRVTANVCSTALRRRGDLNARGQTAGHHAFAVPDGAWDLAADGDDPQEVIENRDAARRVAAAMAELSPEDRSVIVLRDLEGFSTKEAADLLGITTSAAKVRLHRAHARLRKAVAA